MILRKSIAEFWHAIRNPEPPCTQPVVDPELEKAAKRLHRTLGQLHALGISDADIKILHPVALAQRVALFESRMRDEGVVEPKTVLVEPPPKPVLNFAEIGGEDDFALHTLVKGKP